MNITEKLLIPIKGWGQLFLSLDFEEALKRKEAEEAKRLFAATTKAYPDKKNKRDGFGEEDVFLGQSTEFFITQ